MLAIRFRQSLSTILDLVLVVVASFFLVSVVAQQKQDDDKSVFVSEFEMRQVLRNRRDEGSAQKVLPLSSLDELLKEEKKNLGDQKQIILSNNEVDEIFNRRAQTAEADDVENIRKLKQIRGRECQSPPKKPNIAFRNFNLAPATSRSPDFGSGDCVGFVGNPYGHKGMIFTLDYIPSNLVRISNSSLNPTNQLKEDEQSMPSVSNQQNRLRGGEQSNPPVSNQRNQLGGGEQNDQSIPNPINGLRGREQSDPPLSDKRNQVGGVEQSNPSDIERPTNAPVVLTKVPMSKLTQTPTSWLPTNTPTKQLTQKPTKQPTQRPTQKPTTYPSQTPTSLPTLNPTKPPTNKPTYDPTKSPTMPPSKSPTKYPTRSPTETIKSTFFGQIHILDRASFTNECEMAIEHLATDDVTTATCHVEDLPYCRFTNINACLRIYAFITAKNAPLEIANLDAIIASGALKDQMLSQGLVKTKGFGFQLEEYQYNT